MPEAHLLLATKLNAPPARDHLVARGRLTTLLAHGHALTLISAPPGFGKTTLLGEWITSQDQAAIAWLSLDADDNDPLRFVSLILGALWAAWHLPNALLPGLDYYFYSFPAFLVYVVGMTVLFTWLANNTRNSVLLAWIFHAAINISGAYLFIGDTPSQWQLSAGVYAVAAFIVIALTGVNLGRRDAPQADVTPVKQPAS